MMEECFMGVFFYVYCVFQDSERGCLTMVDFGNWSLRIDILNFMHYDGSFKAGCPSVRELPVWYSRPWVRHPLSCIVAILPFMSVCVGEWMRNPLWMHSVWHLQLPGMFTMKKDLFSHDNSSIILLPDKAIWNIQYIQDVCLGVLLL